MSFDCSLRRRRSVQFLVKDLEIMEIGENSLFVPLPGLRDKLPQHKAVRFKEADLKTHDIEIPMGAKRVFRVMVVTPSQCQEPRAAETVERIKRFDNLADTQAFIVFPCRTEISTDFATYLKLRYEAYESDIFAAFLVGTPDMTIAILNSAIRAGLARLNEAQVLNVPVDLIPYCTTQAPMPKNAVIAVSDTYVSMSEFAELGNDDGEGYKKLVAAGVDPEEAENAEAFWGEEYAV